MIAVLDKVRFVETDLMGVVHHSNYFRWFEMARVEYLRAGNVLLPELIAAGIVFPITDVQCKYRQSAHFDEMIRIEATLVEFSRAKMCFSYRVMRDMDNMLLAEGSTQNVFTDKKGRVTRLPQIYFDRIDAVRQAENGGVV
ncbi:MAG TPA: thioesterase family protein [Negativicutes bacterium]|nr:thioesterase family protein [Negativicutes bacterium]